LQGRDRWATFPEQRRKLNNNNQGNCKRRKTVEIEGRRASKKFQTERRRRKSRCDFIYLKKKEQVTITLTSSAGT
jgi:hypothetical protein